MTWELVGGMLGWAGLLAPLHAVPLLHLLLLPLRAPPLLQPPLLPLRAPPQLQTPLLPLSKVYAGLGERQSRHSR